MRFSNASSSSVPRWLGLVGLGLLVFGLAGSSPAESAPTPRTRTTPSSPTSLAELLAAFAAMPGLEARFEEEKSMALLARPLRSRGRLYFAPPSTLLRRVEAPRAQDILIAQDRVEIIDESGRQTIDLATRSEVRPLVESMLWIFTGNLSALERVYVIDFQRLEDDATGVGRWQLRLVPRDAPLSQLVAELRVRGRGLAAETLELEETSGDRTVTRIFEADPTRRFDAGEAQALFGAASP